MVLEEMGDSLTTMVVSDGQACLDLLEDTEAEKPDLVLLDLDLPVLDGQTVLQRRQEDASICRVPTIILSNSDEQETVRQCYEKGANAFISKPAELDEYNAVLDRITEFWFCTATVSSA